MKWSKLWLFLLLAGIMTMATVYYVAVMSNAKESFASGRMVHLEMENQTLKS